MLPSDDQLVQATYGQTGNKLEHAFATLNEEKQEAAIWGEMLPVSYFLLEKEHAQRFCFQLVKNYWGKINLFFYESFQTTNLTIEIANNRLQTFFESPQNKELLFHYLVIHGEINIPQLSELIFGKIVAEPIHENSLKKLYLHKVKGRYFIQPIYSEQIEFWKTLYAKKAYSVFQQVPLGQISQPLQLMSNFKENLMNIVTINRTATIVHKVIQQLDYENPRSLELKQLHLFNVRTHFSSGRRHFLKLKKCIQQVEKDWGTGRWALNEKEKTLLSYMLLQEAVMKKERPKIIEHGLFLIEADRLNNHAVELVVEYSDVLCSMNPQPQALVKNYAENYLEYVFFVLLDALVKEKQFKIAFDLVKEYELATCTVIFEALHSSSIEEELHKIEATVQQDIAFLVDGSAQSMRNSLQFWQEHYMKRDGLYSIIAEMTSQHVCNLLKILFSAEEDSILEKLISVYKKYLMVPAHFNGVREFIEEKVVGKV